MANGTRYRTLWLSDIHLGSRSCQAGALLAFLEQVECERLYLVGDVVDVIALRRSVYWPDSHTRVLRKLLDMRRDGVDVTYIPGNHDDPLREFAGSVFDGVPVRRKAVHTTRDGRRLLVVHGDELDAEMRCGRWLHLLGVFGYCLLMSLNRNVCRLRALLGLPYWSLAAQIKKHVGTAVEYMRRFEQGMVDMARHAGLDGVVCGHIHHAALKEIDGLLYCNDGDWVESCSALVEHPDGGLELLRWAQIERSAIETVATPITKRAA